MSRDCGLAERVVAIRRVRCEQDRYLFTIGRRDLTPASRYIRELWFGLEDEMVRESSLKSDVAKVVRAANLSMAAVLGSARREAVAQSGDGDLRRIAQRLASPMKTRAADLKRSQSPQPDSDKFRVALMGRTQAGKSTLLEALSHGDGARIGDGRQRYSRDIHVRLIPELDIEVIDTPGVGALDGDEDYALAFAAVRTADLVLWIAGSDPAQEQTARALEEIAYLGKPIIVVLNCRHDLSTEIGYLDFMENPALAFRESDQHFEMLNEHLDRVGVASVTGISIHAQAAFWAQQPSISAEDSAFLRRWSQIDKLIAKVKCERESLAKQRRILRQVDSARSRLLAALVDLTTARVVLGTSVQVAQQSADDLRVRSDRSVDSTLDGLQATMDELISSRQTWNLEVDIDKNLEKSWSGEIERFQTEANEACNQAHRQLTRMLIHIAGDVDSEWQFQSNRNSPQLNVPSLDNVWINRALKVGLAVAPAILLAPLDLPALTVLAIGVGFSRLSKPVGRLIDRAVHGEAAVLRKRRQKLGSQVADALSQLRSSCASDVVATRTAWKAQITKSYAKSSATLECQRAVHSVWIGAERTLNDGRAELDRGTAVAILESHGWHRAARSVHRATRLQGIALAVELSEPSFTEAALCLVGPSAERITPVPTGSQLPTGNAVPMIMGLCEVPLGVLSLDVDRSAIELLGAGVGPGVTRAWGDLAQAHLGHPVRITSSLRGMGR